MPLQPWLRRFFWLAGGLLVLGILATLALPSLIKSQAESRGSQTLGRTLTIGAVDFKPWSLELSVSDVKLASADGKSTQFSIARLTVDAALASVWKLAPVLDALTIEQPHVQLTRTSEGHYDIDDLVQRFQADPAAPKSEPLAFALHNIAIQGGSADFTDQAGGTPRQHTLRKLELSLPFVSSMASQRDVKLQPHLALEFNGSALELGAVGTPFAQAPQGEASLQIKHLDLAPYLPYLPASLPVRVKGAVLDSTLTLAFVQAPVNTVRVSGNVQASNVRVDDSAGAPLLNVASVQAAVKEFLPLQHSLALESLRITEPQLSVTRNKAGQWLLPGARKAAAAGSPDAAQPDAQTDSAAWKLALDTLELQGGAVRLTDESVAPATRFALADMHVAVRGVQWPMAQAAQWDASAKLQSLSASKTPAAGIAIQGEGTDAAGTVSARLSDLALSLVAPYLRPYFIPQVQGVLEGELAAQWKGSDVQLTLPRMALHDLILQPPTGSTEIAAKDLPSFKLLEASNGVVDLTRRSATLGKLTLRSPKLRVARDDDGQWMFSRWLVPAAPGAAANAKPAKPTPPWNLKLTELALDDGTLTYVDRVPEKTVFLELSALQARVKDLVPDGKKPVPLNLSAKVRSARTDPGSLRFDGTVMWDPVVAQGRLEASQLPVQAVAPYAMHALRLDLLRADTSFKGQVRYTALPAGPDVQLQGDAAVEELRLNSFSVAGDVTRGAKSAASAQAAAPASTRESEELLTWKALSVPGIDLRMAPGAPLRLTLREVSLSDFFARLIVNPEGRLVLQDIVRPEDVGPPVPVPAGAAPAATPANAALEPVIDVGPIKLVNGRVAFSDRFIQPNYSASLTELSGGLSGFRSTSPQGEVQMADLELRGRAEGTASLEITGKVNPLAKPLALDIHGKVRDLELSPLSSYAIKYAGYGIERGKLSVDVQYTVAPDGKLQANNKIVLNQLVFGDEVPGAAKRLPVKLAVALLADRNGVIDLDLPLSGSLNDPEFRVWPIVWKIVGNIVTKALTAPFKLLGGLFSGGDGGADELSTVAFAPGTTRISAEGQQNLDKVAKAMADKPALKLTVVGSANFEREQMDIRRDRLNGLLLAEKRRVAASAGKDVTAVAEVTADETPALLKEVYRRADIKKPRNLVGLSKDLPAAEMEALLLGSFAVNDDTVRELALNRSIAVREYLTARQLPSERLFLGVSKTAEAAADWQPRVELEIEHH